MTEELDVLTILQGDAIAQLRTLPDESVHCCVTSPPYWGLRDYSANGQLGLEKTPEEYVTKMVEVFREVRRVLRKDGTCWVNMGDAYNSPNTHTGKADKVDWGLQRVLDAKANAWIGNKNLKPKDLLGMPWRLAFALQADGWWLRSDIIWAKPNPMPESVTDRPTKSHEYLFLLTKSASYFYDAEAIKEAAEYGRREWSSVEGNMAGVGINGKRGHATVSGGDPSAGRNKRSVWTVATEPFSDWSYDFEKADYVGADGKPYKVSADCPIHAPRRESETQQTGEYDAQLAASTDGTLDIAIRLVPKPAGESASIPSRDAAPLNHEGFSSPKTGNNSDRKTSDSGGATLQNPRRKKDTVETPVSNSGSDHRACSQTAIEHSSQNHKTAHAAETKLPCNASEETLFRIDDIEAKPLKTQAQIKIDMGKCTCQISTLSHFACFPKDLIKPCIMAGTSAKGCCSKCGSPWERIVETTFRKTQENNFAPEHRGINIETRTDIRERGVNDTKTIGWQPTCNCSDGKYDDWPERILYEPCTVLDPFAGSGTTGAVALELGRKAILIELNPKYIALIRQRCDVTPGLPLA